MSDESSEVDREKAREWVKQFDGPYGRTAITDAKEHGYAAGLAAGRAGLTWTATPPGDRPAWIDAAAKECAARVLVGEGEKAFAEIIERHARGQS
jgi:hypothetical protein